jgi:hypothetical protein
VTPAAIQICVVVGRLIIAEGLPALLARRPDRPRLQCGLEHAPDQYRSSLL